MIIWYNMTRGLMKTTKFNSSWPGKQPQRNDNMLSDEFYI